MSYQFDSTHEHSSDVERVALITGASRGLGKTLATFFARQNFTLIIDARNEHDLQEVAAILAEFGGEVVAIPGDVTSAAHRRALVEAANEVGRLDLLINSASTLGVTPLPPLASYPLEAFEQVLDVNLLAPLALIQEAVPLLARGKGTVINISSDAAVGGYPGWGAYGASKAGLDLVSATLANELGEQGIAVVSVDPGDMRTRMHQDAFPGEDISDRPLPEATLPFWAWLIAQNPKTINGKRYQAQAEVWAHPVT